jgi:hypothetical protein
MNAVPVSGSTNQLKVEKARETIPKYTGIVFRGCKWSSGAVEQWSKLEAYVPTSNTSVRCCKSDWPIEK